MFACTAVLLAGCANESGVGQTGEVQGPPDVIYHGGKIVTVNEDFDIAQAVAVRDGVILAVGSNDEIERLASASTRRVDLEGDVLLPGFNDNHIHVLMDPRIPDSEPKEWMFNAASPFNIMSTWPRNHVLIQTPDDLGPVLERAAAEVPEGEWIVGALIRPYWHMKSPTRWELDKYAPNHPVVLNATHTASVNSLGLKLAGITRTSTDPAGGHVVRDDRGEPVGILIEFTPRDLVNRLLPPLPPMDEEQQLTVLRQQLEYQARMGVTSLTVAGMQPNALGLLQTVYERSGDVLPRTTVQLRAAPYDEETLQTEIEKVKSLGFHTGFGNDRLKTGALKISVDGGWAAPAFFSTVPYPEPYGDGNNSTYYGVVKVPESMLYRISKTAHDLGWQLGFHAIGDAAIIETVNVFERVLRENPRSDHRHYITHFGVLPPDSILEKIADLGIVVSQQPNFTYFNVAYQVAGLEGRRLATNNPSKSLLRHGIRMSYGSDDLPHGPLLGIWSAVTRRGIDGKVYAAEEGVTVEEAIKAYTMGSAYQNFDEERVGSVEPGKAADFVVLSDDILKVDPETIRDIAVKRTIIGGREVFTGHYVEPYYDTYPPAHVPVAGTRREESPRR